MPTSIHNNVPIKYAEHNYKTRHKTIRPYLIWSAITRFRYWFKSEDTDYYTNDRGWLCVTKRRRYYKLPDEWILIDNMAREIGKALDICRDISILIKQLQGAENDKRHRTF